MLTIELVVQVSFGHLWQFHIMGLKSEIANLHRAHVLKKEPGGTKLFACLHMVGNGANKISLKRSTPEMHSIRSRKSGRILRILLPEVSDHLGTVESEWSEISFRPIRPSPNSIPFAMFKYDLSILFQFVAVF
jgi:hypothetical protein